MTRGSASSLDRLAGACGGATRALLLAGVFVSWQSTLAHAAENPPGVKPVGESATDVLLAIKIDGRFYNRASNFRVRNGRFSFIHLEGSASFHVDDLDAAELSQLPLFLRDQIAAEVVREKKRRIEELERLANEPQNPMARPRGEMGQRASGPATLAGPKGSLRFIPSEPRRGGAISVEIAPPRGGGAIVLNHVDPAGGGAIANLLAGAPDAPATDSGTAGQPSRQLQTAIAGYRKVMQLAPTDLGAAVDELTWMIERAPASRTEGEYLDAIVIAASTNVFETAFRRDDIAAGRESLRVLASVGGTRSEIVRFLQEKYGDLCAMAEGSRFEAIDRWVDCLDTLGASYGIALEIGRQRVARKVLRHGLTALEGLRFKEAWAAYQLSKRLWLNNPDLAPVGLIAGLGGAIAVGLLTFFIFRLIEHIRMVRAIRASRDRIPPEARNWVVRRTDPEASAMASHRLRRPSTGPKPRFREARRE